MKYKISTPISPAEAKMHIFKIPNRLSFSLQRKLSYFLNNFYFFWIICTYYINTRCYLLLLFTYYLLIYLFIWLYIIYIIYYIIYNIYIVFIYIYLYIYIYIKSKVCLFQTDHKKTNEPSHITALFLQLLKTTDNLRFSDIFRGMDRISWY